MRIFSFILTVLLATLGANIAMANDAAFFNGIQGVWSGPGKIVAGKYKGTKFVCTLTGKPTPTKTGMEVDGTCRVGVFNQKMSATLLKSGSSYIGKFLDGEQGNGMDVTGGRYTNNRLVADIKRKNLNGIMVANLTDPNALKVSISVRHGDKLVPVIGMNLGRKADGIMTGSVN